MLIKEFIKESEKNQIIATLLKHYKVESVKVKYKSMKDFAYFNVDTGTLELSSRYKQLKDSDLKHFLITMLHEIHHAMDSKRLGWKDFKLDYEWEMNYQIGQGKDKYKDNRFEIEAEEFGQKNWKKWKSRFKKIGII
tara:strand:+ start:3127 stop:3537 length:411 start_codon:yes stop_codon:yes gene_type:complete